MNDHTIVELAAMVAVHVECAPGRMEKRLVLMRAFAQAHQLNSAVTEGPDLTLLDALIGKPDQLVQRLQDLWTGK
jgi:hypothetical protein